MAHRCCVVANTFALLLCLSAVTLAVAQDVPQPPVNGMRPADLRTHAITNATVVVSPGNVLDNATIIIRQGVIDAVGPDVVVPADARVWPGDDLTVYAGLIDAAVLVRADAVDGAGAHWNQRIGAEISMLHQPVPPGKLRQDLRKLGFTVAAVYPEEGIFRGSGAILALAENDEHVFAYSGRPAMAAGFDYGRRRGDASYPGSLMGAIALMRQTLLDAQWYDEAQGTYSDQPQGKEPPARADSLAALADVVAGNQAVLFDAGDELNALRAGKVASEFDLQMMLLGSGLEFRRLDAIVDMGAPIILPLDYPDRPKVGTLAQAERASLRELQTWEQAPTNARRLIDAGATIALTTHRLDQRSKFPAALRSAVKHGLSEQDALAALTTTPARLLGIDDVAGTIEPGKLANLVVVKGSLFDKKSKVRDTWINGRRYEISADPDITFNATGLLQTDTGLTATLDLSTKRSEASVHMPDGEKIKARSAVVQRDQISLVLPATALDDQASPGYVRLSGVISEGMITGSGAMPDGSRFTFTIEPVAEMDESDEPESDDADAEDAGDGEPEPGENDKPETGEGDEGEKAARRAKADEPFIMPPDELAVPLGEYGLMQPPQPQNVLVRNATIWTSGPRGVIEQGVLLVIDGKVAFVGSVDEWEQDDSQHKLRSDLMMIDAAGKHVTPGLIDCHSHTGIDRGINEWTQVNTAEVRVADVINPDDINWYRQLAGGLTAANQLHGSANPIGGQNSVVKLRWGAATAEQMRVADAIGGIKFALGENVVRSQSRYPNTRMGVETVLRDAFTAAIEYSARRADAEQAMPVRRDLELDALVEILNGERLVHCHSYRQDEILMLIRVAEDFGFTIGTFQHVLEGYKVADAIAEHQRNTPGAGASAFSDWWAYKVEVQDAIPFAGALMHKVGVNVSFNSDSSELARRMNTEAAKAVRYGDVPPDEALKFITINPARQLRIHHRTGSLELGKDADFVIWSGDPLSTYTRAEQTWIEGARYFDLDRDRELRAEIDRERQ